MTTADRKRLLVALCAADRVEICLAHFRPADPKIALLRNLQRVFPWLGMLGGLFRRRRAERTDDGERTSARRRPSFLGPLLQLAVGLLNRR